MVRWSKKTRGFFVENLFTVECEELDDLLAVLEEGTVIDLRFCTWTDRPQPLSIDPLRAARFRAAGENLALR